MSIGTGVSSGQQNPPDHPLTTPVADNPVTVDFVQQQTVEQIQTYTQRSNVDSMNDPALQQMAASQAWMAMAAGNAAPLIELTEPKQSGPKLSSSSIGTRAAGAAGSSATGLPASDVATHKEGLELVLTDALKKMLVSMSPQQLKNLGASLEMLMAKTTNDVITHMWDVFQKGVDENNARSKEEFKQKDILDTDLKHHQMQDDQVKFDLRNATHKGG